MTIMIIKGKNKKEELKIDLDKSRVLFVTGAGLSTGAGLPTYYGKGGAYTNMDTRPEDIISTHNMEYKPEIIWDSISDLLVAGYNAVPTISHNKIAEITQKAKDAMVFTQNVDDLHFKSGAKKILHVHGQGRYSTCEKCNNYKLDTIKLAESREVGKSPICYECGHDVVRPNIVPFGGNLNSTHLEDVFDFCNDGVDYCIFIGTQMSFGYIENIMYYVKRYNKDGQLININPEFIPTDIKFDFYYRTECDSFFDNITLED